MNTLTPAEKAAELVGLLDAAARLIAGETPPGSLDAAILPWLVELNRIEGVCTLQSCEGHRDGRFLQDGHLWLRLSGRLEQRLMRAMSDVLALPRVESVSVEYSRHSGNVRPIVSLTFQGLERHRSLDGAMAPLLKFLRELAA